MANKLPKELKKRMDRELRQYWDNVKKIEKLKQDIIEESNNSDSQFKSNTTSDPTYQKAIKLLSTRGLVVLEERILYVYKVINRLKPFEREIFIMIFKEGCDWLYCNTQKRNIKKCLL